MTEPDFNYPRPPFDVLGKVQLSTDPAYDPYTLRAAEMFHIGYLDVEPWQRAAGKTRILLDAYGMTREQEYVYRNLFSPTGRLFRNYPPGKTIRTDWLGLLSKSETGEAESGDETE